MRVCVCGTTANEILFMGLYQDTSIPGLTRRSSEDHWTCSSMSAVTMGLSGCKYSDLRAHTVASQVQDLVFAQFAGLMCHQSFDVLTQNSKIFLPFHNSAVLSKN